MSTLLVPDKSQVLCIYVQWLYSLSQCPHAKSNSSKCTQATDGSRMQVSAAKVHSSSRQFQDFSIPDAYNYFFTVKAHTETSSVIATNLSLF